MFRRLLLPFAVDAVSPIEKVVQLLTDMHQQGTEEWQKEEKEAAVFSQNCDDTQQRLKKEISQLKDAIQTEDAKIAKANAAADGLQQAIAVLVETGRLDQADLSGARKVRKQENADFLKTQQDYAESLDALERAIQHLQNDSVEKETVVRLLQDGVKTRSAASAVSALLDSPPQATSVGYKSAMDGVISMLKNLNQQFREEMNNLVQEEEQAFRAFELLEQGLNQKMADEKAQVKRDQERKAEQISLGAAAEEEKASLNEDVKSTSGDLRETKASCNRNNALYAKQHNLREEELTALQQAIDLMSGEAVSAAGANIKHHGETADLEESFIQLGSAGNDAHLPEVISLLTARSSSLHSPILSALSLRIQAAPFKKVLKMIRDMISRLQEQSVKEAEAHGWCQAKKAETKIEVEDKSSTQSQLSTEKESLTAKVSKLTTEIEDLAKEIAFLSQDRGAATKLRAENKAENQRVIAESVSGQEAVAKAVGVLRDFYASGAEHVSGDDGAGAVTEVYGGEQERGKGVIDILKVIESDFAREEAQRTSAEAEQANSYKKLMNSSEVDVETKKTTKQHKTKVRVDAKKELTRVTNELGDVSEALTLTQKQMEDLTTQCSAQVSFAERVKLRENEIQSLKEALTVLKQA